MGAKAIVHRRSAVVDDPEGLSQLVAFQGKFHTKGKFVRIIGFGMFIGSKLQNQLGFGLLDLVKSHIVGKAVHGGRIDLAADDYPVMGDPSRIGEQQHGMVGPGFQTGLPKVFLLGFGAVKTGKLCAYIGYTNM